MAGASAEYRGYGGEKGNWRSLKVTGKIMYFGVKCLIVRFIPQNPHVRQTWTFIDEATVTVESSNDFVPQMSTGQGRFPNCLRTNRQDGSKIEYTYWSPTGLPVKFLNYKDGGIGGYELNKFIGKPNAMPEIFLLLLQ